MLAEELTVTHWKKYGKNRLYVAKPDGEKVGWWDLLTDEAHPEDPELLVPLSVAVGRWQASEGQGQPKPTTAPTFSEKTPPTSPQPVTAPPPPAAPPVHSAPVQVIEEYWEDLALNKPGEAARRRAIEEKKANGTVYTALTRLFDMKTEERAWRIGADGEEIVGAQLTKVLRKDPRWQMLHAVPVGERGSDIDHVAIGPGGVFTINAKHHPDANITVYQKAFYVNGNNQQYLRNSNFESKRAQDMLSRACGFPVPVTALIVPVRAKSVTIKKAPAGIDVVRAESVAAWLLNQPGFLNPDQVAAIYAMARRSTTWHAV